MSGIFGNPGQTNYGAAKGGWDPRGPENIAPVAVWLASSASRDVTGRVFLVDGGRVSVAEGWRRGPTATKEGRWEPGELGGILPGLVGQAQPNTNMSG